MRAVVAAIMTLALSCQSAHRIPTVAANTVARHRGTPVATVAGEPVTIEDVSAVARAEGVSDPHAALERAITLRLLANEAARRGLDRDPLVEDTRRRAMIQAVLVHEVEDAVPPDALTPAVFEQGMAIRGFQLAHGELWHVQHALVPLPANATAEVRAQRRALADEIRARIAAVPPSARVERLMPTMQSVCGRLRCREEDLPPFDRDGRNGSVGGIIPSFAEAGSALTSAGDVSPVVETPYGFHVIVLVERVPALQRPTAEVEAIVRREGVDSLRHLQLERLLDVLRGRFGTHVSDAAERAAEHMTVAEAPR